MNDGDLLLDLLVAWEDLLDSGRDASADELARDHPHLIEPLRDEIAKLRYMRGLLDPPEPTRTAATFANGRFRTEDELGRGGMGVVYRAEDTDVGRKVALKLIRPDQAGYQSIKERFRREAAITGRLEHPGIVPVYAMGTDQQGESYYVMRLIRGENLRAVIDDFQRREADRSWRDPTERNLKFRELLNSFVSVCQTIAFAHSKGVIHRDLKPANIQVGKYGETLVLDWGMAGLAKEKEMPSAESADPEPVLPAFETQTGSTVQGVALGSPAYMSPEQANGHWHEVGPASDVFSLGATLYHLLTGFTPYTGEDALRAARKSAFDPPRTRKPEIPKPLEAICLKAMARDSALRYGNAESLADDVRQWLADEPVAAYREPPLARARRWARRHRPLVAAVAATTLVVVILGGIGVWIREKQRIATAAKQQAVEQKTRLAMDQARNLLETAWTADAEKGLAEALAGTETAVEIARSGGAGPAIQDAASALQQEAAARVAQAEKNRRLRDALLDIAEPREMEANRKDERGQPMAVVQPSVEEQFAAAFRRWGIVDLDAKTADELAARMRAQPDAVVQEIVAGLDEWAINRRKRNRPQAEWRHLSELAERLDSNERHRALRRLLLNDDLPIERFQADMSKSFCPWLELTDILAGPNIRRLRDFADHLNANAEPVLWLVTLCRTLELAGEHRRSETVLRAGLAAYPDSVVLLDHLGKWLNRQKPPQRQAAIECYRALRAIRPTLGVSLAMTLQFAGRFKESEDVLRDLVRREPDNPESIAFLGTSLSDQGKVDEAVAALHKSIRLQPDYNLPYHNLGVALYRQHKPDEAISAWRKSLELRPDFAESFYNIGNVLDDQGKFDEAVAAFRKAIELQPNFGPAHNNLGLTLSRQGKPAEAIAAFRQALEFEPEIIQPYINLSGILFETGKADEAIAICRAAIALQPENSQIYNNLGSALKSLRRFDEAIAAYQKALLLQPRNFKAYNNLGVVLADQGKRIEAVEAYNKAIAIQPEFAFPYFNLGEILRTEKKFDESLAAFRKADGLMPGHPVIRRSLLQAARLAELEKKLPAVLGAKEKPREPQEQLEFARFCMQYKKYYHAAVGFFADAFAADPKLANDLNSGYRYDAACVAALAAAGQGDDASKLDGTERSRDRNQALEWLRANLSMISKALDANPMRIRTRVERDMQHWLADSDLSSVRGKDALDKLPETERNGWRKLWADVDDVLKRAKDARY